jgi:hypothetical protein
MLCYFLNMKVAEEEGTPPALEVQWQWFPNFIACDVSMHPRLAAAWSKKWSGVLTGPPRPEDLVSQEINDWILEWVALQYPLVAGLLEYLEGMHEVRQAC